MPRFCIALHEGQPCSARAVPGRSYCSTHLPGPLPQRRCQCLSPLGQPCRSTALLGHDYCFTHRPRNRRRARPPYPSTPESGAKGPWL